MKRIQLPFGSVYDPEKLAAVLGIPDFLDGHWGDIYRKLKENDELGSEEEFIKKCLWLSGGITQVGSTNESYNRAVDLVGGSTGNIGIEFTLSTLVYILDEAVQRFSSDSVRDEDCQRIRERVYNGISKIRSAPCH